MKFFSTKKNSFFLFSTTIMNCSILYTKQKRNIGEKSDYITRDIHSTQVSLEKIKQIKILLALENKKKKMQYI